MLVPDSGRAAREMTLLGVPVAWQETRSESMVGLGHGRAQRLRQARVAHALVVAWAGLTKTHGLAAFVGDQRVGLGGPYINA